MFIKKLCKRDNVIFFMASTSICLFFYMTTIYLPEEYDDVDEDD